MLSCFVFAASYVIDRLRRDDGGVRGDHSVTGDRGVRGDRGVPGDRGLRGDRGVTAVEYGLILALIAGVIITGLLLLGPAISSLFSNSASCVTAATGCTGP